MKGARQKSSSNIQRPQLGRRQFLQALAAGSAALLESAAPSSVVTEGSALPMSETFATRGYYFTFCRMPTFGLAKWKEILGLMKADRCNFMILWVAGAFRSRKFPITWQYNLEHKNIQSDFVRELVDFGHSLGIKVVLGFTPFSYDGVNQYPLEHPQLKAYQKDGALVPLAGMDCWGYGLNPSKREAQRFMLEYVSEMYFDFYPNADGLFIESSDYTICYCPYCAGHYYEREFEFVQAISERVWQKSSDATIIVYPHYFSDTEIPHFGRGARERYDPRWTLFFTPHSAPLQKNLTLMAPRSIYWDAAVLQTPAEVKQSCERAHQFGTTGYVVSLESFSFLARFPEDDNWNFIGKRMIPFGYLWLTDDVNPYNYLLTRVLRSAYREFSRNPNLAFADFRERLKEDLFGSSAPSSTATDLLNLQEAYVTDRTWFAPGPTVSPEVLNWQMELGRVKPAQLEHYRTMLNRLKETGRNDQGTLQDPNVREMVRVIDWILEKWADNEAVLQPPYPV